MAPMSCSFSKIIHFSLWTGDLAVLRYRKAWLSFWEVLKCLHISQFCFQVSHSSNMTWNAKEFSLKLMTSIRNETFGNEVFWYLIFKYVSIKMQCLQLKASGNIFWWCFFHLVLICKDIEPPKKRRKNTKIEKKLFKSAVCKANWNLVNGRHIL